MIQEKHTKFPDFFLCSHEFFYAILILKVYSLIMFLPDFCCPQMLKIYSKANYQFITRLRRWEQHIGLNECDLSLAILVKAPTARTAQDQQLKG